MNANVIATLRWRDKHSHRTLIIIVIVRLSACVFSFRFSIVCVWMTLSAWCLSPVLCTKKLYPKHRATNEKKKKNTKMSFEVHQHSRHAGTGASTYYTFTLCTERAWHTHYCQCNRFHMQISLNNIQISNNFQLETYENMLLLLFQLNIVERLKLTHLARIWHWNLCSHRCWILQRVYVCLYLLSANMTNVSGQMNFIHCLQLSRLRGWKCICADRWNKQKKKKHAKPILQFRNMNSVLFILASSISPFRSFCKRST